MGGIIAGGGGKINNRGRGTIFRATRVIKNEYKTFRISFIIQTVLIIRIISNLEKTCNAYSRSALRVFDITLRAETFVGRNFREAKKARNI